MDTTSPTRDRTDRAHEQGCPEASNLHRLFQLEHVLAEDGAGTLFEAAKTLEGRRVAVALLNPGYKVSAKNLIAIDHVNICRGRQIVKRVDGTEAVVMDLPLGEPLSRLLEAGVRFSLNQSITIVLQLLSALHAIHKAGETLPSLTASNLFLSEDQKGNLHLKLVNCGVETDDADSRFLYYQAPEQVVDGNMRTVRSDIWAAGAVLYHLIFGRPLFEGNHPYEVAGKIMLEDPQLSPPPEPIPEPLIRVLERALDKNADQRHPDVASLVTELLPLKSGRDTIQPGLGFALAPTDPPGSPFAPPPRPDTKAERHPRAPRSPTGLDTDPAAGTLPPTGSSGAPERAPGLAQTLYAAETAPPSSIPPEAAFFESDPGSVEASAWAEPLPERSDDGLEAPPEGETVVRPPGPGPLAGEGPLYEQGDGAALDTAHRMDATSPTPTSALAATKIDDLARASHNIPLSLDTIAERLKRADTRSGARTIVHKGRLSPFKSLVEEQPRLVVALAVFSLSFISFVILFVSALRTSLSSSESPPAPAAAEAAPPETRSETPAAAVAAPAAPQRQPSEPAPTLVTIDLLRVPVGATVTVNDAPSPLPLRIPRSKVAVTLTIEAKGFEPFTRLIVPDQDRKVLVEMSRRQNRVKK